MAVHSDKATEKLDRKRRREAALLKRQSRMKGLILLTGLAAVALLALAAAYAPKPKPVEFAYGELPVLGEANAPVKIVEFGDFKCPACRYFSEQIKPRLRRDYIDQGKAALYFMNHTIIGPDSFAAAMAGQSIYRQSNEAFWQFYDAIYRNQGAETVRWATEDFLVDLAKSEGLPVDYDKLRQDIASEAYAEEVNAHNEKAEAIVTGTPTLFINGVKFTDFSDYEALKKAIDKAAVKAAGQAP
ncbi:thioredoxin domain-containing protein [Paenibacillus sp. IB182493]|uniref:Thioredoxin domain-containing protein n=2 Tax=Paenibacillus arenilitoris TaxID=2772299 RepID=A0A927H5Z1_9BACL|nr:thioredoxin domain-containing protein [Paenibacillus arenilitoris]